MSSNTFSSETYPIQTWHLAASAWFRRTDDPLGDFSNFAVGMPITIHGVEISSSEHLYQAMRFPNHPEVQLQILTAESPKTSKTISRDHDALTREDWDSIRVAVMRWVLARKILANPTRMEMLFDLSEDKPIVELSKRDSFWGAAPECEGSETLIGRNVLGCLLTELRAEFRADRRLHSSAQPAFTEALLLSKPI